MILGALLVISIVLAAVAWTGRNSAIADYNALQEKIDDLSETIRVERSKRYVAIPTESEVSVECPKCWEYKRDRDKYGFELRRARAALTQKQKDKMRSKHQMVATNDSVTYVIDPSNSDKQVIQIAFTVKNRSSITLKDIFGRFNLYDNEARTWQKKFVIDTLAPGTARDIRFTAPGDIKWNGWYCDLYPSIPVIKSKTPGQ
jgi:hypothetical protein